MKDTDTVLLDLLFSTCYMTLAYIKMGMPPKMGKPPKAGQKDHDYLAYFQNYYNFNCAFGCKCAPENGLGVD